MYDVYTKGRYQFTRTRDLEHFALVDNEVRMNFHPRHGTVLPITAPEASRLAARWLAPADVLLSAQNPAIRPASAVADTARSQVSFAVPPGTNLRQFDPAFAHFAGATVAPAGAQNFAQGPVSYTVTVGATTRKYAVQVATQPVTP
jgi:hypothetical protein